MLILSGPLNQVEAARGHGGIGRRGDSEGLRGSEGFRKPDRKPGPEGYRGSDRHPGSRSYRDSNRHRGDERPRGVGGFLPGLIIGGVLGWGLVHGYHYPLPLEGDQLPRPTNQGSDNQLVIYPRQGQSEEKQTLDFDECHDWAVAQTGFDPKKKPEGDPNVQTLQKSKDYLRAISACLDARGYTLNNNVSLPGFSE